MPRARVLRTTTTNRDTRAADHRVRRIRERSSSSPASEQTRTTKVSNPISVSILDPGRKPVWSGWEISSGPRTYLAGLSRRQRSWSWDRCCRKMNQRSHGRYILFDSPAGFRFFVQKKNVFISSRCSSVSFLVLIWIDIIIPKYKLEFMGVCFSWITYVKK